MDPLAAIGLASNIIAFVDFASKLVSQGYEIYKSGALQDNVDIDFLVTGLSLHINKLKQASSITAPTQVEQQLQHLASRCATLADEISTRLNKLKVDTYATSKTLGSMGKALKTAWGKKDLEEKMSRLKEFRDELQFGILVLMKEGFDLVSVQHSEQFDQLEEQSKQLLLLLIQGQNVFAQGLATQTNLIVNLHQTTETNIKQHLDRYEALRLEEQADKQIQIDRDKEDSILQRLGFSSLERRYTAILPAHAKTFEWIFELNSGGFSGWLEGKEKEQNLFWINGKAGSGKSTLMKYIYDHPRTKEKLSRWTMGYTLTLASFFFWINGDADQCSQTGLLRSLLHHLLLQHRHLIRVVFPDLWEALSTSKSSLVWRAWSLSYLSKALVDLLGRDLGKVVLFIDGLDEYHGDHDNHLSPERPEYHREIVNLLNSISSSHVKICFSSRPLQIFHTYFDHHPKLRLQDLTYKDIYTYAHDKLVNDPVVVALRSEQDWEPSYITSRLVKQADGVFLWVVLIVASLLTGIEKFDDFEELEKRLELAPSDLMGLYRHMLKQIEPLYLAEGCKIFSIANTALMMTQEQKMQIGLDFSDGHNEELCMLGLWFALEYSEKECSGMTCSQSLSNDTEITNAILIINRKLRTRCAGLLEVGNSMPNEDWEGMDWYETDNVLMGARFSNRRLQYLHRTTKEFLDLEATKSLIDSEMTMGYDPNVSLLWSTIQKIRIWEPESHRPFVDRPPRDHLLCLANSAFLLARNIQYEGKTCPAELLNLLDSTMQHRYSQEELPWVTQAMYVVYQFYPRYCRPFNSNGSVLLESWSFTPTYLDPQFNDDFLSLAIVYGLVDYTQFAVSKCPLLLSQKSGRPYLDYALANYNTGFADVYPKMVQLLLSNGADPDEYCPTSYSVAEWSDSIKGRVSKLGYTTWTPWQSALQSTLWTTRGSRKWRSAKFNPKQYQNWIQVFKDLLAKEPDVSVITWIFFKSKDDEPYTVSETITTFFSETHPLETSQLLTMVEKLAHTQGVVRANG